MIVEWSSILPGEDDLCREDWARWQVDLVRRVVHSVAYEPLHLIIAGCIEERADEFPTAPEDHWPADSLGVFYDDGDEDDAQRWAELCARVVEMLDDAIDWNSVRPSEVVARGKRMGLCLTPSYRPHQPVRGVAMTPAEIATMEDQKDDRCRVELARRPNRVANSFEMDDLGDRIVLEYTEFMAGSLPDGVELRWLWKPSTKWIRVQTERPAKVVAGWGMDCADSQKDAALVYAEGWRLAYYAISGAVEWESIDLEYLRGTARDLGIILEAS
jgi:hypothetical protein